MTFRLIRSLLSAICLTFALGALASADDALKQRQFTFDYGATFSKLTPGKTIRIWLAVPPSNDYQQVREVSRSLPAQATETIELKYGNRMLYLQATVPESGEVTCQVVYDIDRKEVKNLANTKGNHTLSAEDRTKFLAPDKLVPPANAKALKVLGDKPIPSDEIGMLRFLYDRVDDHVEYSKTKPGFAVNGGKGNVDWVCDSRFGNCCDFHSLFISLARAKQIPSFFAIGFPIGEKPEDVVVGYHCWAFAHTSSYGWIPVDISEADKNPAKKDYFFGNLTADRVTFTVGRDLELSPKQDDEPLNYFVYPYAEVDGKKVVSKENVKTKFGYKNK